MSVAPLLDFCRSLSGATEDVKWESNLVFSVGGKMFCVFALDDASPIRLSFKVDDGAFFDLVEHGGFVPAPYLAHAKWVGVKAPEATNTDVLEPLVRRSYELVRAKLPKKVQASLG